MNRIADWPHVAKQSEVQQRIDDGRKGYVTFALCTPTSIMPARRQWRTSRQERLAETRALRGSR
jgi:hypothetical protein